MGIITARQCRGAEAAIFEGQAGMLDMDIPIALALLKRLLDDIVRLKRLPLENKEFPIWDERVKGILKEAFGPNSNEYARYDGVILSRRVETQEDKEQAYIDHVCQRENALKEIIHKHDLPVKGEAHAEGGGNIKAELEQFYDGLIRYKELVMAKKIRHLTSKEEAEFQELSLKLQRKYGNLKEVIEKYGGPAVLLLQGGKVEYEAFSSAFTNGLIIKWSHFELKIASELL